MNFPEYATMSLDELTLARAKVERRFIKVRKNTPLAKDTPCPAEWRECVERLNALTMRIIDGVMNQ